VAQVSTEQLSPLAQPSSSTHASLRRQSALAEQYSVAAQFALFGAWLQAPAKHWSSVHFTPSLQSESLQHSPHVPSQHTPVAGHFAECVQEPSAAHWSTVQAS